MSGAGFSSQIDESFRAHADEAEERRVSFIRHQLEQLDEEQLTRFEFFVRSHFNKNAIKDILTEYVGKKANIADETAIIVGSLTKLFVGELVETASDVINEEREALSESDGKGRSVKPAHIMEAMRRLRIEGKLTSASDTNFLLNRKHAVDAGHDLFDDIDGFELDSEEEMDS